MADDALATPAAPETPAKPHSLTCQRCGTAMDLRDPAPGTPWAAQQFWVCPRCGRHFWTTHPAATVAPPKPAAAAGAKPAPAKPAAPKPAAPAAAPKAAAPVEAAAATTTPAEVPAAPESAPAATPPAAAPAAPPSGGES